MSSGAGEERGEERERERERGRACGCRAQGERAVRGTTRGSREQRRAHTGRVHDLVLVEHGVDIEPERQVAEQPHADE